MKKIVTVIVLSACLFFQACRQNPESAAVNSKNNGLFESKIENSPRENIGNEEINRSDVENDGVVEKIVEQFSSNDKKLLFTIDLHIDSVKYLSPVIRVAPHQISSDEAKKWANVLFDGNTAYEATSILTKEEIERQILFYKELMNDEEWLAQFQDKQATRDYYSSMVENYEAQYDSAPEFNELRESDWLFQDLNYYEPNYLSNDGRAQALSGTQAIEVMAKGVNGHSPVMKVLNRDADDYKMNRMEFYYLDEEELFYDLPYCELSADQAVDIADKLREELALSDWVLLEVLDESDGSSSKFTVYYTPVVMGNTVLHDYIVIDPELQYAANYDYSQLEITVYNGTVVSVWLTSPLDVVEVISEVVETISLEEAYQTFVHQMKSAYDINSFIEGVNEDPEFQDVQFEIDVSNIQKGLFRVKEKNNEGYYLLVPSYIFIGEVSINGSSWGSTDLCLINAVDGTLIDAALGY